MIAFTFPDIAGWLARFLREIQQWIEALFGIYRFGFDRDIYPDDVAGPGKTGDDVMRAWWTGTPLHFVGFWLHPAPSNRSNRTWMTKREVLRRIGWGFLPIFYGRQQMLAPDNPEVVLIEDAAQGTADADQAVTSAKAAGFPKGTIIYLDVETGGRLEDRTVLYVTNWVKRLVADGMYRPGIYCSFFETAQQLKEANAGVKISFWVYNVRCKEEGKSPGCALPLKAPDPAASGVAFAEVWQYAKSPYEPDEAGQCGTSDTAPGYALRPDRPSRQCWVTFGGYTMYVDLNTAISRNPSGG